MLSSKVLPGCSGGGEVMEVEERYAAMPHQSFQKIICAVDASLLVKFGLRPLRCELCRAADHAGCLHSLEVLLT